MDNSCNCHSEISRDGSGQLDRYLKALDPSYAPIDNRTIEDLLVFTKRYANQIRFYDIPESHVEGGTDPAKVSWREFFRRDIAVIAASIAIVDLDQFKKDYDEQRVKVEARPGHETFDDLFDPILGMAAKIDSWCSIALPGYPLYDDLQLAINSNLKSQIQKIVAYEEGFKYVDSRYPLNLDYSAIKNKELWGLTGTINADISIYQGTETEERVLNAMLAVDDIFNSFYSFLSKLVANSESYLQFALEQYPAHQPHMALFIAFLKLFRLAQDQMNGLTGRMLDFYYKEVLHLTTKPSIPDKVHIVFELAKDVTEYDITQYTQVKAGKDSAGKEQIYKTESDLVVNGAKVKELKTIFIEKEPVEAIPETNLIKAIYARPVANSPDGFGEPFTDPNPKWPTFGNGNIAVKASNNLCSQVALLQQTDRKDEAQVGFAIASPQLVLQGGNRLITLAVLIQNDLEEQIDSFFKNTEVLLSAADGWLKIDSQALELNKKQGNIKELIKMASAEGNFHSEDFRQAEFASCYLMSNQVSSRGTEFKIAVYLPIAEQAIVPFNPEVHTGYAYNTTYPVMQLLVSSDIPNTSTNLSIENVSLAINVGSINTYDETEIDIDDVFLNNAPNLDGLKMLTIINDDGLVTPNQPFDPFTAYPNTGSSLYIGSDEVFNKPIDALSLNFLFLSEMTTASGNRLFNLLDRENIEGGHAYLKASVLEKRQWTPLSRKDGSNFTFNTLTQNVLFKFVGATETIPLTLNRTPISYNQELNSNAYKGFIKIENNLFFQRDTNLSLFELMQQLAQFIKVKEVSLSYHSNLRQLDQGIDQFFHIYPFGVAETYMVPAQSGRTQTGTILNTSLALKTDFTTLDKEKKWLLVDAKNALLPGFNYLSPYAAFYEDNTSVAQASATVFNSLAKKKSLGNIMPNLMSRSKSRNAVQLMLSTGSIREKTEGVANQYAGDLQEGMLFIGLENLKPLQSVSMLFQFAEGSAENEDDDPPPINWSYLSYNEWKPMKAENIVSDGTYGFQTTGIIKIDFPADASAHNTIITDGLSWLCASVTKDADRIPQLINIVTQAVEATFEDQGNDPSHFDNALQAGSISKLAVPVAQVSKVQQPFASFDGKHSEIGKEFYTRVSERLRHKARAINAWDYEHLVLDRFPGIYKVKCITHTDPDCLCRDKESTTGGDKAFHLSYNADNIFTATSLQDIEIITNELKTFTQIKASIIASAPEGNTAEALATANRLAALITADGSIAAERITTSTSADGASRTIDVVLEGYAVVTTSTCCGPQVAPGHVLLIPIANLKYRNSANPLQPKTSRRTLLAIQDYLKTRTPPFVHVHAKNPVYEQIIVSFKVKFYSGTDKGFYMKMLNDEIVHFLTPWAFDEEAAVTFNQEIYASSIINFIEERPYVDFITDFIMGVCCNECCPPVVTPAGTNISGRIQNNQGRALENVSITVLNEDGSFASPVASDAQGNFSLAVGQGIITLNFSLFGYETKIVTVGEKTDFQITLYKFNEVLQRAGNCHDIEQLLQNNPGLDGDIVARPCTSRSILVSVPHHIIVPYEEPSQPSPCEKRIMDKVAKREPAPGEKSSIPGKTPTVKAVAAGIKKREGEGIQNKPGGAPEGIKPIKRSAKKHIKPRKPE